MPPGKVFDDKPELFPKLNHSLLKEQARIWSLRYPFIARISLHRDVGVGDPKYVLVVEVSGGKGKGNVNPVKCGGMATTMSKITEAFTEIRVNLADLERRQQTQVASSVPTAPSSPKSQRLGADEWLLTWGEISWRLGVSEDTAQRYARREEDPLPVRRLGGRVTIRRSAADEWREAQPLYRAGKGKRDRPE
jgi:hypothetical protein